MPEFACSCSPTGGAAGKENLLGHTCFIFKVLLKMNLFPFTFLFRHVKIHLIKINT